MMSGGMALLESHSSEPVPLPVSLLWGRCVLQHLCSCPGPSTYSLGASSCKVDELCSRSHRWALQHPAIGDLWEHVAPPPKEIREIHKTESGCSQPLTSPITSPAGTTRVYLGVSLRWDSTFPLAALLQGILCVWLKSARRTSPVKVQNRSYQLMLRLVNVPGRKGPGRVCI